MKQNTVSPCLHEPYGFVEELRRPANVHLNWAAPVKTVNHKIHKYFPDSEGVLDSAYESLEKFMAIALPHPVSVKTEHSSSGCPESYCLKTGPDQVRISAGDTEGIRRGIYELIRKWRSSSTPVLAPETIFRKPWLKNRISRCFFSPINRPPNNQDELLDGENYYPDAYLDRLAASGINGLWISAKWEQLCETRFYAVDRDCMKKRLEKLQRTVDRCRRYGIRIFLQTNEPAAWVSGSGILKEYPELGGTELYGRTCCCPTSPEGAEYLEECCFQIFSSIRHLGGLLNIALGEGLTTCASDPEVRCLRCSEIPRHEILLRSWTSMLKGIRRGCGNATGKMIAWLYLPGLHALEPWMRDLFRSAPEDMIIQLNCESGAGIAQQGKIRFADDYWLSVDHPSKTFREFVKSVPPNVGVSAKIQVGCSHEVATVPFVPVPGLLYRKYRALHRLGVSSVMQCWFFGNYPGMMNEAAGLLAFEEFQTSEHDFLCHLASADWGRNRDRVARAWEKLGKAYKQYPVCNMLQYFGPVADGITWPLYFHPANQPLSPTWIQNGKRAGDNLCECLMHYSMEDLIAQMRLLCRAWTQGSKALYALRGEYRENPDRLRDIGLAEALEIQFRSACNILEFYALRLKMQKISYEELKQTERMLALVKRDSRLGFHSEAECYKYDENALLRRKRELLQSFPEESYVIGKDFWKNAKNFIWRAEIRKNLLKIHVKASGVLPEMDEFFLAVDDSGVSFPLLTHCSASGRVFSIPEKCRCRIHPAPGGWSVMIAIPCSLFTSDMPLRIQLLRMTRLYQELYSWPKVKAIPCGRLNLMFYHPDNMGLLIRKSV